MPMDELGMAPDYKVNGLSALPDILSCPWAGISSVSNATAVDLRIVKLHSGSYDQ
jgi:hypothetical protein